MGGHTEIGLDAVIVAVTDGMPRILAVNADDASLPGLPSGPLRGKDSTLERSLRRWIREQAGLDVGYAEQLYTFGDLDRAGDSDDRLVSIAYLAFTREENPSDGAAWIDWYELFPWEDHRTGVPPIVHDVIVPAVSAWVDSADEPSDHLEREERAQLVFGLGDLGWDGVRVLERYELLYEVGLLEESPAPSPGHKVDSVALRLDHRRIVATALGRLRGKLTYRPVVFELLPATFTLLQLQQLVEALSGVRLHKQNFRRLVEGGGLVEGTGRTASTGGRPAELFRFRREVLRERPRPGVGTPWTRG